MSSSDNKVHQKQDQMFIILHTAQISTHVPINNSLDQNPDLTILYTNDAKHWSLSQVTSDIELSSNPK